MKKLNKKGFTIVELVIVIAVIAILAGVLIPTFATVVDKANKSSAEQQARNFYTLLEAATAAPTTYTNNSVTYAISLQKTGLVVAKTAGGNEHVNADVVLKAVLGDDAATYAGAKVWIDSSVNLASGNSWTIPAVYFQPKGSNYYVKIDLVAGTVGGAEKVGDSTVPANAITLAK